MTKGDQTIAFAPLGGKTYGDDDFTVSATATSGLAVTFTAAGQCTVTGTTVDISAAGTCTITAHQSGNDQYNAAPAVSHSFTIDQATPVVTVTGGASTYDTQAHPATATAAGVNGSSVAGSFAFTYNGGSEGPVNAGSYAVGASFTSSDANYKDATGTGAVTIDQAMPVVTVTRRHLFLRHTGAPGDGNGRGCQRHQCAGQLRVHLQRRQRGAGERRQLRGWRQLHQQRCQLQERDGHGLDRH